MNIKEIQTQFEGHIGDTVDLAELVVWLNEAQRDIALRYGVVNRVSMVINDIKEVALPTNFMAAQRITLNGELVYPGQFTISPRGYFCADEAGTYVMDYLQMPLDLLATNGNNVPEINPVFHDLLALFAAARYFDREAQGDSEEMTQAQGWMSYYRNGLRDKAKVYQSSFQQVTGWTVMV